MKQATINLYSFSELNKEAKRKAIDKHLSFLLSQPVEMENDNGDMEDQYYEEDDFTDDDVIENIEGNEYLFYSNGQLAHCTTYVGKHEKAGTTEFHLQGETFKVF